MFGRAVFLAGMGLAALATPSQAVSVADESRFAAVRPVESKTVAQPPPPLEAARPKAAPSNLAAPPRTPVVPPAAAPRPAPSPRPVRAGDVILLALGLFALVAIVRWLARRRRPPSNRV